MSMHTQLLRGLLALPVAALLLAAGVAARDPGEPATAQAEANATATAAALPRVDFHSMIPGALHIVRKVKLEG
ncbi:hypothetical protein LYSHEL_13600 [Lysobacter helvus]|uniref:Uncharacterized protein n=2 Tax=Lysobacteraceae TaxID=32033 RepID=A0ABM7Q4U7_9GAMM|nr:MULTISPECIES: hypothetical protein [Lysobacter]BCT92336.1 hypothetical protein LYSCAS_13600 [Lysobacter caseinilyticus]BCT95489.1 hypothetical protein LYSHEL_13600 [Lysobacter helvus]